MWHDSFCQVVSEVPEEIIGSFLIVEDVLSCHEESDDLHTRHLDSLKSHGIDSLYLADYFCSIIYGYVTNDGQIHKYKKSLWMWNFVS
jgi:hypothetical protein